MMTCFYMKHPVTDCFFSLILEALSLIPPVFFSLSLDCWNLHHNKKWDIYYALRDSLALGYDTWGSYQSNCGRG